METAVEFTPPLALGYGGLGGYKFSIRIGFSFAWQIVELFRLHLTVTGVVLIYDYHSFHTSTEMKQDYQFT